MVKRKVDLSLWTPYDTVGKSREFKERIESENKEFNLIWENSETTFYGSFFFLADESELTRWENFLFLSSAGTIDQRRKRVFLKWNTTVTWTDRKLKEFLDVWLGYNNYNYELKYNEYSFLLKLNISKMLKINEKDIYYRLRQIIPANIVLNLEYKINDCIFYNDKVKNFENRLYTVGQTYKTGTVYKQQYTGSIIKNNIHLNNKSNVREQRQFKTKEIRTGGVKSDTTGTVKQKSQ